MLVSHHEVVVCVPCMVYACSVCVLIPGPDRRAAEYRMVQEEDTLTVGCSGEGEGEGGDGLGDGVAPALTTATGMVGADVSISSHPLSNSGHKVFRCCLLKPVA